MGLCFLTMHVIVKEREGENRIQERKVRLLALASTKFYICVRGFYGDWLGFVFIRVMSWIDMDFAFALITTRARV